ncbi:MAG: UDP-N-acetyl-D-mannosamine dehydrogenase [Phycisphaera sp.]|nr:UDP-N-acetyl-D-mannosamine dehydrogenase [Phycisphaera sp.]
MPNVCIVGLGYIGLPTAAVLSSRGYTIHGVEVNPAAIQSINSGKAHIVEPDLDMLVQAGVQTGRLKAHPKPTEADIFMVCVPTPITDDLKPELKYVKAGTESICPYLKPGNLVILESTSPPGTTEMIADIVYKNTKLKPGEIFFAHAPERVLPGKILREVIENDRIIGGIDDASTQRCAEFYKTFVTGELLLTSARTAETAKLTENAFRDVNIAFANELSLMCEELGIDVWELIRLANRHPRVNILSPGPGVGGHCIAVDPYFLVACAPKSTHLMKTAREVNRHKPHWVVERVKMRAERFKNPRIACLGLAYKPDIDDLRESPAVEIVEELHKQIQGDIRVVEPYIHSHPKFKLATLEQAIADADIILILVAHRPFKKIPQHLLAEKIIIDTCGVMQK